MKAYELKSPLKKKKVALLLKDLANPKSNSRKLKGVVTMDSFSVKRYYFYHNKGLAPQINGELKECDDSTIITAKATVDKRDMIMMIISSIIVCAISLFLLSRVFTSVIETIVMLIVFLLFIGVVCFLNCILFKLKANEIIKILKEALSAE